jgi:hypothetical protein
MDLEGQPEKDASQNAEQGALNQFVTEPIYPVTIFVKIAFD